LLRFMKRSRTNAVMRHSNKVAVFLIIMESERSESDS
jgi:hypothetical protein